MTIAQALKTGLSLTHRNLRLLFLQIVLNAVTLGLFYFFLQTPETTVPEVIGSLALATCTLFIFALTQAGTFSLVAQASTGASPASGFFRQGLQNSWRFILATLPIALLGYLLFLAQNYALKKSAAATVATPSIMAFKIVWYVILPAMLVILWTAVARYGLAYSLKNGWRLLFGWRLGLRSFVIFIAGFVLFALAPYFLIAVKTLIQSPWLEFSLLTLRLGLSYLLAIYGWTVTAGAMTALLNDER